MLDAEDDEVTGEQVTDEGIEFLKEFNRGRNPVGRGLKGNGARPHG